MLASLVGRPELTLHLGKLLHGLPMNNFSAHMSGIPEFSLQPGEELLQQNAKAAGMYFLKQGKVKVHKDGYQIAVVSEPGAVFGEMAYFLDHAYTASVQCLAPCTFYHLDNPAQHLAANPALMLHICKILSTRLFNLNQYLVDVKKQYEGHDHLDMVNEVLETLMNQQKDAILKRADSKRDTGGY